MIEYETHTTLKKMVTPATHNLFEVNLEEKLLNKEELSSFHTTAAQLLYLCKRARLDIQFPVLFMCTRVREANVEDKRKLDRVVGFLKGSIHRRRRILNTMGSCTPRGEPCT